ncbi:hypothetical protein ACSYAD_19475 [Acaryochloris marina NIES-2412]|uniref:hypothetical protein n=1 Tax=Acaryochloris marina TaxID=155978 RepID=UPI0040588664
MPKRNTFRFAVNTEWSLKTDRAQVFSQVEAYYGKKDFKLKSFNLLHTLLKPLSVALSGGSRAEVLRQIAEARDKMEILFDLAITLVSPKPEPKTESQANLQPATTVYSLNERPSNSLMEDLFDD